MLGSSTKITVSGTRDQRIAAIGACQRGRVSRQQLLEAGLTAAQVTGLLRSHRLFRLHAGVYAVGHLAPTPLGRETAALLALRPGARLAHRTAARLWGLEAIADDSDAVHVLVDARWAGRRPGIRVHRTRLLDPSDIRMRAGLPVTSPARALLDVTPELSERTLERAYDQAIAAHVMRRHEMDALLERMPGHPGRRRMTALLADAVGPTLTRSEAVLVQIAQALARRLPAWSPEGAR